MKWLNPLSWFQASDDGEYMIDDDVVETKNNAMTEAEQTNLPAENEQVEQVEQNEEFYDVSESIDIDYAKYGKKALKTCVNASIFGLFVTLIATRTASNLIVSALRETLFGMSNTFSAYTYANCKSEANALKTTVDFLALILKTSGQAIDLLNDYTVDFFLKKAIKELEPSVLERLKIEGVESNSYSESYNKYFENGVKVLEKTPEKLNEIAKEAGLQYKSCLVLPKLTTAIEAK
jgi:hypothetical protein